MRVAFVAPWGERGGVSEYAASLVPKIAARCAEHLVLAEDADGAQDEPGVIRCWRRGESLERLVNELERYKPDVLYVEHQYGLFPDQDEWLLFMREASRLVPRRFVKMHCVYAAPMALITHDRDGVGGYESPLYTCSMGNIIVHTEQAASILRARGATDVWVVPHGFHPYSAGSAQANHVFSFGFGLKYKGLESAVQMVRDLLPEFPDLLYMGVFGDEPRRSFASQHYVDHVQRLILDAHLEKSFLLFRGYRALPDLMKLAQSCALALFPYAESPRDREVYGASGAVRMAMSWGLPVVTSRAPLFSDLDGVVAQGKSADQMREHVRALLRSPGARSEQAGRQRAFVEAHSWDEVARRHVELFKK